MAETAVVRKLRKFAWAHPLLTADDALLPDHHIRASGGITIALSLNR